MRRSMNWTWTAALLAGWIGSAGVVNAGDRSADVILKDIESVVVPAPDRAKVRDQAYVQEFMAKRQEAMGKRAELILELYKAAPDHARIPDLLVERWRTLGAGQSVLKEIDEVIARTANPKLKIDAAFAKAQLILASSRASGSPDLSAIKQFMKLAPGDPRGVGLLYSAARTATNPDVKAALEERIIKDYPDSRQAGMIKGGRRQSRGVGQPFELEFTDAIKGSTVSMAALKGKVVVVDFWATWCGPCVREMPKMKDLYAKYQGRGVEFIGVSLDQPESNGGLAKLKAFVETNKIGWPQYYQGKGWDSEFSTSWGINAIPCVFIVDTEGKLYSVKARGKLEEMISELLSKKNAVAAPAAGGGGE